MARNLNDVIAALSSKRRAKVKQRAGELSAYFPPEWHGLALKEAERAVAENRASFVSLDSAKKKLRNRT
jgi:hypothetical protein